MSFEIEELEAAGPEEYRVYVTDGVDSFCIDRASAQRLCDLLNDGVKKITVKKETK